MIAGFKKFVIQGNAIDLAVGIIMGLAFSGVVTALVEKVIMPIVAGIAGKPNFDNVASFTIGSHDSVVSFGALLTAVVNLVLVAGAVYFFIVVPINALKARRQSSNEVVELTTDEKILATLERIAAK